MKRVALAALCALAACKHDREPPHAGGVAALADAGADVDAAPRARPSELAHLTLKVLGMT